MINKKLVADLDEDVLKMAIKLFLKNASEEIPALNEAYKQKNFKEVKRLAHKLKGSSIAVGLEEFSQKAGIIEETILESKKQLSKDTPKQLLSLFNKIKKEFS